MTPKEREIEEWKAALAEEFPDEDWIQRDKPQTEEFEPRPWHGLYFRAFDALQFDRFIGSMGGEGPIYYQALSQYARDYGISGADLQAFHLFMNALDGEYLKIQAERQEKDNARRDAKNGSTENT